MHSAIQSTAGLEEFLRDESRTVGFAETISFPKTEEDIIQTVREEISLGHRVTVQGGRTGLAAAAVPHGGHVLNVSRMNRILGMRQDADGTFFVTVEPGCVLAELKKALASRKIPVKDFDSASLSAWKAFSAAPAQQFPPDPTETSATIGGMVACNASGAKSYLYGPTRRWVEALRVVLPDGDVLSLRRGLVHADGRTLTLTAESGRKTVLSLPAVTMPRTKNASGYYIDDNMDAVDLFIGSDGTLGVVSLIELRLCPEPAVMWGVTCFFDSEEKVVRFVNETRNSVKNLASLEYFDGGALELLRQQRATAAAFARLPEIADDAHCAVYTEIHCRTEAEAYEGLFAIGDILCRCGGDGDRTWVARTAQDRDRLYFFRHATPESVNMRIDRRKKEYPDITKLGSDMSVPDEKLGDVLDLYRRTLADAGLEYVKFGHIGNNHLHVNILPRDMDEYRRGKELFRAWAAEVTAMGGAVSAEHGVGKLKASFLEIMYGREVIAGMAALKRVFDPQGLLGTGNLFDPAAYLPNGDNAP